MNNTSNTNIHTTGYIVAQVTSIIMFCLTGIITLYLLTLLSKMGDSNTGIESLDSIGNNFIGMVAFVLFVLDAITFSLGIILRIITNESTIVPKNFKNSSLVDDNPDFNQIGKTNYSNDDRLKI